MPRRWLAVLLPWLVLFPLGLASRAMQAAPDAFTVNSTADVNDAIIGDGFCDTPPSDNVCTLRAAIQEASANTNADTIIVPAGTYVLTPSGGGDLDITGTVTIAGASPASTIIDGNGSMTADRVFDIRAGTVNISGVKIVKGMAVDRGGGIYINNGATLNLSNSVVQGNTAFSGVTATGGGIYNEGNLTISGSTVSTNTIIAPLGQAGAGIFHGAGSLVMTDTAVSGNITLGDGGGIYVDDSAGITVTRSSSSNNQARNGAGLFSFVGVASIVNSTFSGNLSTNSGAGLYTLGGITSLFNVTVTNNRADSDAAGGGSGGGVANSAGVLNFDNSIIAANFHHDTFGPGGIIEVDDDCSGTITSQGANFVGVTGAPCTISGIPPTTGVPLLGPLADNGGSTRTHALLQGSPGIDEGDASSCNDSAGTPLVTDQRGSLRPAIGGVSVRCDLGAFEFQEPVFLPLILR